MQCLGIDIGTDSARLHVAGCDTFHETHLSRISNGRRHTMAAASLWESLMAMLDGPIYETLLQSFQHQEAQLKCSSQPERLAENSETSTCHPSRNDSSGASPVPRYGVCVAATCSMVVMERVFEEGAWFFRSLDPGHEIIVWMDTRAQQEARMATGMLPDWALQQVGGQVTPEMGIAKLLWVDHTYKGKNVCVFELYDWVSYVFLAGGFNGERVRCLYGDEPSFGPGKSAMDGSVKGWGADILQSLGISAKVVAPPNQFDTTNVFPYVGSPLGLVGDFLVGHGCIDCYAPWAGLVGSNLSVQRTPQSCVGFSGSGSGSGCSLLIVAGTSTCFIASGDSSSPIKGFWGPFSQLLPGPVYTFGQPATGQLFGDLFEEFRDLISPNEDAFAFVERKAAEIETRHGSALTVLARHYFYYGDKHGNRSPYGDFDMGEIFADGANCVSDDTFQCSLKDRTSEVLVLRYYLTLEFLILQTKQLCSELAATCGAVSTVHIEGSQAQNSRFVDLLHSFVFPASKLYVRHDRTSKFSGSRGVAAALGTRVSSTHDVGGWRAVSSSVQNARNVQEVLTAKYSAFLGLASWQASFRQAMRELSSGTKC